MLSLIVCEWCSLHLIAARRGVPLQSAARSRALLLVAAFCRSFACDVAVAVHAACVAYRAAAACSMCIVRLQWLASDDGIGGSLPVSILKMLCLLLLLDVCIVVCQSLQCGGAGLGNP